MMIIRSPSPDRFIISLYHTTEYITNLIIICISGGKLSRGGRQWLTPEEEYDVDWAGLNFEERRKKRRREDSAAKEERRNKRRREVSAVKGKSQNTHPVEKDSVTFPAGSLGLTLSQSWTRSVAALPSRGSIPKPSGRSSVQLVTACAWSTTSPSRRVCR